MGSEHCYIVFENHITVKIINSLPKGGTCELNKIASVRDPLQTLPGSLPQSSRSVRCGDSRIKLTMSFVNVHLIKNCHQEIVSTTAHISWFYFSVEN